MTQSSTSTKGGVRAVIFDISGTTVDYGSRGPVIAFVELFARHGVAVSEEEARRPMGTHKKDHLWAMLTDPAICGRWTKAKGKQPTREALDQLYDEFPAVMKEALKRHSDVIPGVARITQELRSRGIRIANTTGFDADMMDDLKEQAAAGGYSPDLWVTPDLVGQGRPFPWMAFYAAHQLGVYPMSSFVKVGDTLIDVAEGHNAGMWTVSVVRTGNEVGLSEEQLAKLVPSQRDSLIAAARQRLKAAGPHYVIDAVAELMPVIDEISSRIDRGERP
ncbi:MAG: phosphonoacetaldehyde hydrolase [Candidatus Korobacteraceae bacterium]|jgi:phosphonoacetaldehyde hydrolase